MIGVKTYQLSLEADLDIDGVFDYTEERFGFDQAVTYIAEFKLLFSQLIGNPEIGRQRDEIKQGLRSIPKSSHVVFYRIMDDHIRIVRVLHGSRDLPRQFE